MKSQKQMFYEAHRVVADTNNEFMEAVRNGLTREELQSQITWNPDGWKRFENWLDKLPSEKDVKTGKEVLAKQEEVKSE